MCTVDGEGGQFLGREKMKTLLHMMLGYWFLWYDSQLTLCIITDSKLTTEPDTKPRT